MATRRKRSLTTEDVARAAVAILDAEGVDALSMRRLADALGVGTMTLYGHVRDKGHLLDLAVDAVVLERAPAPPVAGASWRARLQALVLQAHELLRAHPALVEIRLRRPVLRPEALRFGEAALELLDEAGYGREEAAQAFRLLFTYVFGYAALSGRDEEAARRQADVAVGGLPSDEFPRMTGARREVAAAMAGEAAFHFGLERLLDGLEARVAAAGPGG